MQVDVRSTRGVVYLRVLGVSRHVVFVLVVVRRRVTVVVVVDSVPIALVERIVLDQ